VSNIGGESVTLTAFVGTNGADVQAVSRMNHNTKNAHRRFIKIPLPFFHSDGFVLILFIRQDGLASNVRPQSMESGPPDL
jgi:hypothetical protein